MTFVVIEGLDGSGTSTQLRAVDLQLQRKHVPCWVQHEPNYESPTGKLIQQHLHREIKFDPYTLALLYAADRYHHLQSLEITTDEILLMDRYHLSSLAYQTADIMQFERQYPEHLKPEYVMQWIWELQLFVEVPDHTFYLDVHPDVCAQRIAQRKGVDEYFDPMLKAVSQYYDIALRTYFDSSTVTRINGEQEPEIITETIVNKILSLVGKQEGVAY